MVSASLQNCQFLFEACAVKCWRWGYWPCNEEWKKGKRKQWLLLWVLCSLCSQTCSVKVALNTLSVFLRSCGFYWSGHTCAAEESSSDQFWVWTKIKMITSTACWSTACLIKENNCERSILRHTLTFFVRQWPLVAGVIIKAAKEEVRRSSIKSAQGGLRGQRWTVWLKLKTFMQDRELI